VASVGAKLVAVNNLSEIKNLLKKMMVIIFTFLFCVSIFIFFFKETIIEGIINIAPNTRSYSDIIEFCLYITILWQPLEFAHRTLQGICISGGDTKFVSTMNAYVFIGFNLTSILTLKYMGLLTSIRPIMCIFTIDAIGLFIVFYLRYKSLKWFKKII
jgi:Na+-driven multidrug efflux pump